MKVKFELGAHIVTADFNNTATAREFCDKLPMTVTLERYDNREYYSILSFTPTLDGERIDDFSNGDVTFFPELNTLAIFFARAGESSQPGLIRMGRIVSGIGAFEAFDEKLECIISEYK